MGDFFEWDAGKFALRIPMIDDEHQRIIEAMNRLHQLHTAGGTRASRADALQQLRKLTIDHFRDEEGYMEKIGYPDLRKHHLMHKHLLDRLEQFAKDFQATGVLTEELFMFLKMWLKAHICGIDSQYAAHAHAA